MLFEIFKEIGKINEQVKDYPKDKDYPKLVETMEQLNAGLKAELASVESD